MNRIEALRSAINAKVERSNALRAALQEYATRDGDPSDDERAQFEADVVEFEAAGPEIERMQAELTQLVKISEAPERAREIASPTVIVRNSVDPFERGREFGNPGEVRDLAFRAIEQVSDLPDEARAAAERLVRRVDQPDGRLARHVLLTGRDAYRSAFQKVMANAEHLMTDAERQAVIEARASSLTDAAGGYAIPFTLDPSIIHTATYTGSINPFRALATVTPVTGDNWNGVSSAGLTAGMAGERDEVIDAAPTLAQPSISVKKAQAFVKYTEEIYADWSGYEGEIRTMFMWAKDVLEDSQFSLGSGSGNNVNGIVTDLVAASTPIVASVTSNAIAAVELYALEDALAARFRAGSSFVATRAIFNKFRQLDTGGGAALWERIGAGLPSQLLGYPIYECESMDSTYGSGENYVMIFGDVRQCYRIIDRVGMTVQNFPALFGTGNNLPNGTGGLRMVWRFGAKVVNTTAAKILNVT